MPVEVSVKKDIPRFKRPFHHHFHVVIYRESSSIRLVPLPIQVNPEQGTSVIANYDAIRVLHGYYFENKLLSQVLGLLVIRNKKVQNPLQHPGGLSLSRMHSCC